MRFGAVSVRLVPLASGVADGFREVRYKMAIAFTGDQKNLHIPVRYRSLKCVYHLDPHRVKRHLPGSAISGIRSFVWEDERFNDPRPVFDDLWDRSCSFRAPYQMFVDRASFQDTDQYQTMLDHLDSGKRYFMERYYRTREDLDDYFRELENVFESIQASGYKSQKELGGSDQNEIRVCISPQGEILKVSAGKHRFAIANILELESVPVVVIGVARSFAESALNKFEGSAVQALNQAMAEHFKKLDR